LQYEQQAWTEQHTEQGDEGHSDQPAEAEKPAHLKNLRIAAVALVQKRLTRITRDTMTIKSVGRLLGYDDLEEKLKARGLLDEAGKPYDRFKRCRFFAEERRSDGSIRPIVLPHGMTWIATAFPPVPAPAVGT
jgi:hypothetical protein